MDIAPGADNQARALLALERDRQAAMLGEHSACALEVSSFVRMERGRGQNCRLALAQHRVTVVFEQRRLARAQALKRQGKFEQTLLNRALDAHSVTIGLSGNHTRLPEIKQTTDNAGEHQQNQGVERCCTKGSLGKAVERERE